MNKLTEQQEQLLARNKEEMIQSNAHILFDLEAVKKRALMIRAQFEELAERNQKTKEEVFANFRKGVELLEQFLGEDAYLIRHMTDDESEHHGFYGFRIGTTESDMITIEYRFSDSSDFEDSEHCEYINNEVQEVFYPYDIVVYHPNMDTEYVDPTNLAKAFNNPRVVATFERVIQNELLK
jgi:hypothetical protein